MKKETKQKIFFYLATKFGWLLILLLGKLSFVKVIGYHYISDLQQRKVPFIILIWHGRILLPIYLHRKQGISPIISLHGDGEMIARTVIRLGYKPVRGSSTRGGNKAFHDLVTILRNGGIGAVMPDGPRGPRHKFKPGALYLAQRSGAVLLPLTFACKRKIVFKSWDRFNLITPFSKAVVVYSKPVSVPPQCQPEELEQLRIQLEQQMIADEKFADNYFKT